MKKLLLLLLALPTPIRAQALLSGLVRAAEGGQPLPEVEILLPALQRRTLTKADGSFALPDLPPGVLRIVVRRIGYQPVDLVKMMPSSGTTRLELRLVARAIVLDSLLVTAVSERHRIRMLEFERRRQTGIGSFLTRKELEAREGLSLQTLLREFGIGDAPPSRSRASSIRTGCREVQLFVDGVRRAYKDLRTFEVRDLEAIEIYTGTARVPLEFEWDNASCGVLAVWTRTG